MCRTCFQIVFRSPVIVLLYCRKMRYKIGHVVHSLLTNKSSEQHDIVMFMYSHAPGLKQYLDLFVNGDFNIDVADKAIETKNAG